MEGPGERVLRRHGRVAQPREPPQQHVDLELRALGPVRDGSSEQRVEHRRRAARDHVAAGDVAVGDADADAPRPSASIALTSAPVASSAPAADAQRASSPVSAPIPPTGTSHAPGPVADHVVEEAAVLAQVGVVRGRERADQRVGQHDPAQQVVVEDALDRLADRALEQRLPDLAVADPPLELLAARPAARASSGTPPAPPAPAGRRTPARRRTPRPSTRASSPGR